MILNVLKRRRWRKLLRQENLVREIREYLLLAEKQTKMAFPWYEERFVVLDTETTGLNPQKDHIVSIGAVVVRGGEIWLGESLHLWLDNPSVSKESILIHGILPEESQAGLNPLEAGRQLLTFLGASPLVGHHLGFDLQLLERQIGLECPGFFFFNQQLDTAQLARRLENPFDRSDIVNPQDYALDKLIKRFDLPASDRHTALGDAFITAQLFLKLMSAGSKKGWRKL